ncbi:hypothetical protein BD0080_05060 [Helicobacter pylori]
MGISKKKDQTPQKREDLRERVQKKKGFSLKYPKKRGFKKKVLKKKEKRKFKKRKFKKKSLKKKPLKKGVSQRVLSF